MILSSKNLRLRKRGSPMGQGKAKGGQEHENGGGPALTTLVTCPRHHVLLPSLLQRWCRLLCLIPFSRVKWEKLGKVGMFPDLSPGLRQKHITSVCRLIPQVSIVLKVKLHGDTDTWTKSFSSIAFMYQKIFIIHILFLSCLRLGYQNDICLWCVIWHFEMCAYHGTTAF